MIHDWWRSSSGSLMLVQIPDPEHLADLDDFQTWIPRCHWGCEACGTIGKAHWQTLRMLHTDFVCPSLFLRFFKIIQFQNVKKEVKITLYWKQDRVILKTSKSVCNRLWGNSIHHCLRMALSTFFRTQRKQISKCLVVVSLKITFPRAAGMLSEMTFKIILICSFCGLEPTIRDSPSTLQE